ncbi:hypothetical protein G3Q13_005141 [Escherichia coli]|nr:hypothetical protein [Escherichia coli]EFI8211568.1 hypothetical protein [Escherichia coli]EFI9595413.1 hypothetical protein [Escherichia coli]EFK5492382.1 hypothetical protein [Escherichia coli]
MQSYLRGGYGGAARALWAGTGITGGIRLSDWYYKYKKLSESNVKDLPE